MNDMKVHFMHEVGKGFVEIARELGITPNDAAMAYVKVESAKARHARKEKVVYRKRLSKIDVKSRHQKLSKMVNEYVSNVC